MTATAVFFFVYKVTSFCPVNTKVLVLHQIRYHMTSTFLALHAAILCILRLSPFASEATAAGVPYIGGKMDDITVIIAKVLRRRDKQPLR